jgi:polyhydroxyalkanoate synthesis regulator phasin
MAASKSSAGQSRTTRGKRSTKTRGAAGKADGLAGLAEQLANRILKPLGLVVLSREKIQETLDEAAERGRLTRTDANALVAELVRLGRQQTDELLSDLERMLGQGRQRWDSATKRARSSGPLDRIVRSADKARRTVGVGPAFPISGYDELTAGQVQERLDGLAPADLRKVRDYERRHANRKSVLAAIEKALP